MPGREERLARGLARAAWLRRAGSHAVSVSHLADSLRARVLCCAMERVIHVHVAADDPAERAWWVGELAAQPSIAVVGAGPTGVDTAAGGEGDVWVVVASREHLASAHDEAWTLARLGAPVVVLVDPEADAPATDELDGSDGGWDAPVPIPISAESAPERLAAALRALSFGLDIRDPTLDEPRGSSFARMQSAPSPDPAQPGWAEEDDGGFSDEDAELSAPEPPTDRERDVLSFVARGATNRQVAEALGISEHTVKFHLASLLSKFGAATRTDLVVRAIRAGELKV